MRKLIARKSTIAAAIKISQEKIERGYQRGISFYAMPDTLRDQVDSALGGMRKEVEPGVLETLQNLHQRT
jgi:hypothetical protein